FAFARRSTLAHGVRPGAVAKAGEARIVAVRATRERVAAHARVMGHLLLDGDEPPRAARGTRTCGGRMRRRYRNALDARSVRSLVDRTGTGYSRGLLARSALGLLSTRAWSLWGGEPPGSHVPLVAQASWVSFRKASRQPLSGDPDGCDRTARG